jgi:hypothetical protein
MKIDIAQLEFIDKKLRRLLLWLEDSTGLEFTITSQYRENDKGVHGQIPLRGIDLRMRDELIGERVRDCVNINWFYDPKRPDKKCAVLHGEGANLHLHIQVHANTERI